MSAPDAATVAAVLAPAFRAWFHSDVDGYYADGHYANPDECWQCAESVENVAVPALLAAPPIAQALAAVEAVARVEALDRGHVERCCTFPDDECICTIPLLELRAALRPGTPQ